ncbi:MAG: hypothetical protein EOO74_09295 [Myxococcales bacterium]|nr:MAG: hypothetical protein EOO74_09295 [Myxococcales bacterium]
MSDYNVVLLIEQALSQQDAVQVWSLHNEVEEPVHYQVLLPVENAATSIESGIGALGAADGIAVPALSGVDLEDLQRDLIDTCQRDLDASVAALVAAGARATGEPVSSDPIAALAAKVQDLDAREAIILTRPHVVAEFFHLDWTSRARRKLGVPVLHLIEHETFDEQAGEGEGVTGL